MYYIDYEYPVSYATYFYLQEIRTSIWIDVMRKKVKAFNHKTRKSTYKDIDEIKKSFFGVKKEYILEKINN